jgi:hypothetical protein
MMLICCVTASIPKKENTGTLLEESRDIGLEINADKTKYIVMSRHSNSGQNKNIRIDNESCGKFQILGDDTNKSE